MATVLYFIGGLSDLSRKGSAVVESVHNQIESAVIKEELLRAGDKVLLHQYPQRAHAQHSARNPSNFSTGIPVFTNVKADDFAACLCDDLEQLALTSNDNLIVVAYSGGSAIFRAALAKGLNQETPYKSPYKWPGRIRSVIHVGGMTLGWQFNSEMNKLLLWCGPIVRNIPILGSRIFPFQLYRGSTFIANTRIQLTKARFNQDKPNPRVTYILGTKDQYISPADAIEPGYSEYDQSETVPIYLEASGGNHQSIIQDDRVIDYITSTWKKHACSHLDENHSLKPISAYDLDDYLDPLDNLSPRTYTAVKHVVIILHGIRDNGYWAKRIAHRIKEKWKQLNQDLQVSDYASNADESRDMRVVTLSYGYFSLWDFVRPGGRTRAVEWFLNAYADIVALYPNAEISFIGHSNGTYLGTQALELCETVRFKLMLLAGSVVRRDFWTTKTQSLRKEEQAIDKVEQIVNIIGVHDWIVGLLPGGFEAIPILRNIINLGGAGAYGFLPIGSKAGPLYTWRLLSRAGNAASTDGKLKQYIVKGGHGAGIAEVEWEKIASLVCKVHQEGGKVSQYASPDQVASAIGLPIQIGDNSTLLFNHLLNRLSAVTGLVVIVAYIAYFLPYLVVIAGILLAVVGPFLSPPLAIAVAPYVVLLAVLLISATARGILKSI